MEDSQDFDPTFSPPLGPAHLGSEGTTKVLVQDVPSQLRDCILLKYYLSGMIGVDCDVRQYQKGKSLLATFCRTIGNADHDNVKRASMHYILYAMLYSQWLTYSFSIVGEKSVYSTTLPRVHG